MLGTAALRRGIAVLDAGRPVRALIDTAGSALCLSAALADELDLEVHEHVDDQGVPVAVVEPPALLVGEAPLDTEGMVAYAFEDPAPLGLAARGAELLLPATVLRRHHVVLDDPSGAISIGPPGSLERSGVAVPATFEESGVVSLAVEIDGETFDFVIDSALTSSLAADAVFRRWQERHPDWPASASAVGPGNMTGLPMEARLPMLRVPMLQVGPFSVPQVAFAWRGDADLAGAGALGGNVLQLFRVDLDYSARSVRLEQGAPFADNDAELVGVVLALDDHGWLVSATVSGLEGVRPGDLLVAVDGTDVVQATLPEVLDLLRGTPGDRHRLTVHRGDETIDVAAPVFRLL